MENADLTLAILQNIRAELVAIGTKVDALGSRMGALERRFDVIIDLKRHVF